jgi:putative ATP-binding cassette transporter
MLDEATSALDAKSEAQLYGMLKSRLPDTTVVSIGHRLALVSFHQRQLELNFREEFGGTLVAPSRA